VALGWIDAKAEGVLDKSKLSGGRINCTSEIGGDVKELGLASTLNNEEVNLEVERESNEKVELWVARVILET